jgi:hypothetical protein
VAIEIIEKIPHGKGILYKIRADDKEVAVLFLSHAIDRIKKWKITEHMAVETLVSPEEVLVGHRDRLIAHRRYGEHLLRAVYEYEEGLPALVTLYFPYAGRYWQGGGAYEDQILG